MPGNNNILTPADDIKTRLISGEVVYNSYYMYPDHRALITYDEETDATIEYRFPHLGFGEIRFEDW